MGKLYAVGFGPGGYEHMTAKAIDVIKNADIITGYTTYVEMLKKFFPEKEYVATPMTKEMDRCRMAVDLAAEGKTVAMVSSGDSGIYGLSCIIGILAVFAPSGLGVREGIMLLGLGLVMPKEYAVIISIISRLWQTVAELILIAIAFIVNKIMEFRKKKKKTA